MGLPIAEVIMVHPAPAVVKPEGGGERAVLSMKNIMNGRDIREGRRVPGIIIISSR